MRLLNKLKITVYFGALLLTAGLVYGVFERNMSNPFRQGYEDVVLNLHVIWTPPAAKPTIGVQMSVSLPEACMARKSPWECTVKAPVATRVILTVMQTLPNHSECTILRDGNVVAHDFMDGPGTFTCQYLVE